MYPCYSNGMTTTQGTLTYTRQNRTVAAEIIDSRRVYTLVREIGTGATHRLRTDRLSTGTETERGHISFTAL